MKLRIIGLLLLLTQLSFAQIFTIETIKRVNKPDEDEFDYAFPLIHSSRRPAIASKMNLMIQKNLDGESDPKDPFKNVTGEAEYFFETGGMNERLLCLTITGSHTGAGYHVTRTVYNFDSRTAELIDLNKLFGADGQTKLRKTLCKYWKEALKANQNTSPEDEYRTCLADAKTTTEIDVYRMLIMNGSIKFWAGQCLDGSNYEIDATKGPHELSFAQLLPMLTPYGYSLFTEKNSAAPFNTLLRGTIDGKYPISLTLSSGTDGTVGGVIVYDRVGTPIALTGKMDGDRMILHELDESKNSLSDITIGWTGTTLSGAFINLKAQKRMAFVASPVAR